MKDIGRASSLLTRTAGAFLIRRSFLALALAGGFVSAARAEDPGKITTLSAIHALTNAQASKAIPVEFNATVVYSRGYENLLFVEDGDAAVFVRPPSKEYWVPGDRVLIKGTTQKSFRPIVIGESVTMLFHGALPEALPSDFSELIRAQHDSHLVSVHATVRAADLVESRGILIRSARLQLITPSGHIEANLDSEDELALKALLDAEVEVIGVAAGKFDDKMQQTGVVLYVSRLSDVKVLKRAGANPWALPLTPMDEILADYQMRDLTPRVRVHGTITYYQPGAAIVLQDGSKSLWLQTHTRDPFQIGDQADATGFPDAHDRLLTMTDAEIADRHVQTPITPIPAKWEELAFWSSNRPVGHQNDLVSIEGKIVAQVREASQDEYVLESDGKLFTAIYRRTGAPQTLPPMVQIPAGSRVRVTGICTIADAYSVIPGGEVPFNILLRSFDDIAVIANPSLLSIRNLIILAGLLLVVTMITVARGWTLERKVRRQAGTMAQLEKRRSQILEGVNSSRPLAEIIEQITELVSFSLNGAPCWCEVADGARLGNHPADAASLRIVSRDIAGHSGVTLGTIFAGFRAPESGDHQESQALETGARLAVLAIETRRLYTDLVYRSEFDTLTDIHNRFSLDRYLGDQICKARANASIFGLVYADLDKFKQVNDVYGHRVGDLYLQEVALRMKHQLRSGDMLARLGGDEFAVLVPVVRSRAEVDEIARRLENCLSEPFSVEGYLLTGSASVGIALYPEDGTTNDSLLSAADAAMYVHKQTKSLPVGATAEVG